MKLRRKYRSPGGPLVEMVAHHYRFRVGKALNLESPSGYNEKIQWLKVHDQMPEHIVCCDKLAVRGYVAKRLGIERLVEVFVVADRFADLPYRVPAVVKASNDSGSVALATDEKSWQRAEKVIERGLGRTYGVHGGEWAYSHVRPRCFTERALPEPVIDYKFHCCAGEVRWVQIIAERKSGRPLETITDPEGCLMGLHLDHEMRHGTEQPDIPGTWGEMRAIAEELSKPFRYVRVDLYSSEDRTLFGELTFWPKSGIYRTKDEPTFGALLDFDMSFKRPQVHP